MNTAPFYIGQKVVCLTNDKVDHVKGSVYVVKELIQCKKCLSWWVGVVEHPFSMDACKSTCECGKTSRTNIYWRVNAKHFAPVNKSFESISFTKVLEEELVSVN